MGMGTMACEKHGYTNPTFCPACDLEFIMIEVDKILDRWGATSSAPRSDAEAAKLLGISIGLGTIFDDNSEAEKAWMNTFHEKLGGIPVRQVLAGNIDGVLAVVEWERGLR
jgi:hypothetical protein